MNGALEITIDQILEKATLAAAVYAQVLDSARQKSKILCGRVLAVGRKLNNGELARSEKRTMHFCLRCAVTYSICQN